MNLSTLEEDENVSSEQDQPQADIDDIVGDDQAKVGGGDVSEDGAPAPATTRSCQITLRGTRSVVG